MSKLSYILLVIGLGLAMFGISKCSSNVNLEGTPWSKTEFGKWQNRMYQKCRHIIMGEIEWRGNKTSFDCWYHGKIVFSGNYDLASTKPKKK